MSSPTPNSDRMNELLAARALGDIDRAEQSELDALVSAAGDDESLDLLAAQLDLALAHDAHDAPPAHVLEKLDAAAAEFTNPPEIAGRIAPARTGAPIAWVAAAACLLLAVLAWRPGVSIPAPPAFDELAAAPGALTVGLSADLAGEQPVGRLVWDESTQRGVMRFEGLPVNDPSVEQYQLWIFDASRESFAESPLEIRHPVDGGVFDIAANGVVEVPIDAKIPVGQPVLFAVTIEPPGGVVVSDRSRIAAVGIPG